MGRTAITLGIWDAMIRAAGSVEALAETVGLSRQNLYHSFTGARNLSGPSRELALAFAREKGIPARLYIHPRIRGAYLISSAGGWYAVMRGRPWSSRVPSTRGLDEDWSQLSQLELPFSKLAELLPPS